MGHYGMKAAVQLLPRNYPQKMAAAIKLQSATSYIRLASFPASSDQRAVRQIGVDI
jgi:hypothetical protein